MSETETLPLIGQVLRASTVGFVCGTRSQSIEHPAFGAFVRTQPDDLSGLSVIGLIHAISIDDDPLVRQMILANNMNPATIRDQRENRMVPLEISVLNVGYEQNGQIAQALPPRPPLSLDPVYLCDAATVARFTARLDFLRLILSASDVPTEELLAAALKAAARVRPEAERRAFLVEAGRQLAGLLSQDLPRLQYVLRLLTPA
jgi:hypothetical protein